MEEVLKITKDIKAGNIKPIYFLMGEEPYYIDKLSDFIANNILTEAEKDFNQSILYGRDCTVEDIISAAKRFPLMADRQVIIVREAQDLVKTIEQLEKYAENSLESTVLVICYKYKTLDKRKKLVKTVAKKGVLFESKKLYDNQVGDWIKRVLSGKGLNIEPKATAMLVEFLGNDLSKISNELDKLSIILPSDATITAKIIETNIGFSKDFNVFELQKALGERNELKAYTIAQNFAQNPKDNPIQQTTTIVFGFFLKLLKYHSLKDKNPKNVAAVLGVNPYFLKDYDIAMKNFPLKKVTQIIADLREMDIKSKGVNSNAVSSDDLLKEMIFKIFN